MNYRNDDREPKGIKVGKPAGRMPKECPERAKAVDEILERLGGEKGIHAGHEIAGANSAHRHSNSQCPKK